MAVSASDIYRDRPPEELHNIRLIRNISGCYTLSSRKNSESGRAQVFACRTQSVSPTAIVLEAPVCGNVGELVLLKLVDVGILRGQIDRKLRAGFNLALDLTDEERTNLAAKLDWMKKRQFRNIPDKRANKRRMPRQARAELLFVDGTRINSFIIDMSRSGVAISADAHPAIGTPVAVGKLLGRVVRNLDVGFAVQFVSLRDDETLEEDLTTLILGDPHDLLVALKTYAGILAVTSPVPS